MPWLLGLIVSFHLCGVAFTARPGVPWSRRLLAAVLALMVPLAGPFLGALVRSGRGRGALQTPGRRASARPHISAAAVQRLSHLAPVLDRLMSPDAAERLAALVAVSSAGDAGAVALLRWTLDHGTTEVALDAALALEELDLRREARRETTGRALEEAPSYERALAAGEAAAEAVLNRLGDGPSVVAMAEPARAAYRVALSLAPERWVAVSERLAQLELAVGLPEEALAHLDRMVATPGTDIERLAALRERAAFAARRFANGGSERLEGTGERRRSG